MNCFPMQMQNRLQTVLYQYQLPSYKIVWKEFHFFGLLLSAVYSMETDLG